MTDTDTALDLSDPTVISGAVDYFGFDVTERFMLPDGVQYVELKKLTEGDRRNYLAATNKDVRISRATGDASMKMVTGEERAALLEQAIVGWNLQRTGSSGNLEPVTFSKGSKGSTLNQFLDKADPSLLDKIELKVRQMNPWLMDNMSVEDIDKQIDELQRLREIAVEREAGNDD
jgi:hypothetical protein